jgi:hypothetical protein
MTSVDVGDDNNNDNNISSTTSNEVDNSNRDDGKVACASTAMTSAHRQWRRHSQL